ncbi:MAG: hypothetical protein LC105_06795 [Chitinophagales bacterium]|nr:hypothetical protein [Chitinophagales bacterium]MCZ2393544.1 hypothetical protein [Chitinophagales bacterium]
MSELRTDPTSQKRKNDHIDLAFSSQTDIDQIDKRFSYEPLLGCSEVEIPVKSFLGKEIHTPIWVGSMTGGTEKAYQINENLARACNEFKMGMGLGSCRQLLEDDTRIKDFDWRHLVGEDRPFYANLGIFQIEELLRLQQIEKIEVLVQRLRVNGLFIHVNPLQEWLQPEGDKFYRPAIETIQDFIERTDIPVIVKEVGQGMGKNSLSALMKLPIQAIEFAAHGGTNFSKLELLRSQPAFQELYENIIRIGHSAEDMVEFVNQILEEQASEVQCKQFIISGGIKNFLDGYYYMNKLNATAIYGQASTLLKYATISYEALREYIQSQREGLKLAQAYLKVNE